MFWSRYAAIPAKTGNHWFDAASGAREIYGAGDKAEKVTKRTPPPATGSRRQIQVDSDGIAWLAQPRTGQIIWLGPEARVFMITISQVSTILFLG